MNAKSNLLAGQAQKRHQVKILDVQPAERAAATEAPSKKAPGAQKKAGATVITTSGRRAVASAKAQGWREQS